MIKYLLVVFCLLSPALLHAQEVQIPFDAQRGVQVIGPDLESKLHLFPAYPDFIDATLYQRSDSSKFVDISYFEGDKKHKHVLDVTDSTLAEMRRRISHQETAEGSDAGLDQSSRSKFIAWESILSVFNGILIGSAVTNDASAGTGYGLLVGAAGFLVPFLATAHSNVTDGESSLALGGAFLGYAHGAMVAGLLSATDYRTYDLMAAGTSILETCIGFAVADKYNIHEGKADVIRYTGLLGAGEGAGLAYMISGNNTSQPAAFASMLIGSGLGLAGGAMLASDHHYTRGNATVLMTASLLGSYSLGLLATASLVQTNSTTSEPGRILVGAAMLGMAGGFYAADRYLAHKRLSTAEGNYVILGTTAGYLAGEGLSFILLAKNQNNFSAWSLVLPTVIGSCGGFLLMLNSAGLGSEKSETGMQIGFNPGNWMGMNANTDPKLISPTALTLHYGW